MRPRVSISRVDLLFAVPVLLLSGCLDVSSNTYADFSDLKESEYYQNGWIPDDLPRFVTRIEVTTNIDTNEIWIRARFGPTDSFGFQEVERTTLDQSFSRLFRRFHLRQRRDLELYRLDVNEVVAVSRESMTLLYYRKLR